MGFTGRFTAAELDKELRHLLRVMARRRRLTHFACNVSERIRSGRDGMTFVDTKKARCRWECLRCQTFAHY